MTDTKNQMESKEKWFLRGWILFLLVMIIVIIIWLLSWFFVYHCLPEWSERGAFGDMFGGVNALFSGLAFAGILIALRMQKRELALQREELKLQRMEMEGQKKQLEIQNKTSEKQRFENTFFQLLDVHNKIIIALEHPMGNSRGRKSFIFFHEELQHSYLTTKQQGKHKNENELINEVYKNVSNINHISEWCQINHYFGNLYTIINFVHNESIVDKKFYTDIIRSQLSPHELVLLFYHCLNEKSTEGFYPLVNSYSLLKDLNKSFLLDPDHDEIYSDSVIPIRNTEI